MSMQGPDGLIFTHIFAAKGRTEDVVHGGEIDQALEAAPEHGGAGGAVALAAQIAAQLGNPAYRLGQGGDWSGSTVVWWMWK